MKNLLTLLLLITLVFFAEKINATTYYFSSTDGDDSRTSAQAQNSATPWKTLSKLTSIFSSLQPGDAVLFKRGDSFYGSITVSKSGSSGSPITFGDYGSGNKPVITGLSDATGWTSIGSNLWESAAISAGQSTAMIATVGGVSYPMGKWPNGTGTAGWRVYGSASGSSLTDNQGAPPSNFTGGTLVIRKNQYSIQKGTITNQSGSTFTYTQFSGQSYSPSNGYGYFVQNHLSTLDAQNEWYYNPSTKKLDIYSTTTPTNVKVSTVTSVIDLSNRSSISFNNLTIQGSISDLITMGGASNITFQSCVLDAAGNCGVWGSFSNCTFQNNTISNSNNFGIFSSSTGSVGNNISNNTVINCGVYPGMTTQDSHTIVESAGGILCFGGVTIQQNTVRNTGYANIYFKGSNVLVKNNYCDSSCMTKDESASIYSYVGAADNTTYTNQVVDGNIVLNALGAIAGKSGKGVAAGIYMDINVKGVSIINNTIANCATYGILMQDNQNDVVRNNTVYNCTSAALCMWTDASGAVPSRNIKITKNIFVTRTPNSSLGTLTYQTTESSATAFGVSDSNVIATPMNDVNAWFIASSGSTYNHYSLPQWLSSTGQDAHSQKSPKTISTTNDLRFEYNTTNSNKLVNLGAAYMGMTGTSYDGSITLAPYSSAVLLYTSGTVANQSPVANAGSDQNFFLPTNSTTVSGSGTDPDGTIASYQWTKVSGPSQFTIASSTQAQTTISNLAAGVYQFEFKVTDNQGASDKDTMIITVSAASNQLPVANAGPDIVITLPTNSATLTGTGNDPDGTVASYQWSKISGPTQYSITSATQAQTNANNLVQGVYQFELKVTDNSGGVDRDTMQVIVNAASNQPPVANAGPDINITLPVNSVTLNGSGSDPDGTVASYQWTKVSGPSQYSIVSLIQAQTTANNLVQGVYLFELRVTDNSGAADRDTIQVTVNAAPNQSPTANAGLDINITLPANSLILTGSGTDPDGTIASYQWTKISGPAQYTIVSATLAQTTINNLAQGTYTFELKVTDNLGATGRDTVTVIVNAAPNQAPVANAGTDQSITLPTNSLTLFGSGTDADGTIASYQWKKVSGPSQYTIVSAIQAQTTVNNLVQGVYLFELTVTDNSGATDKDTVQVTVNAAPVNQPPSADAGLDISITLPTNSVTLSGSGNDPDGTIASYRWAKVSGPSQYSIASSGQAQTAVNNLAQGVYLFELRVTDNGGATGRDTVEVTVNAAPVNQAPNANAGLDINITLPVNSVTVSGTGNDPDGTVASYQWTKVSGPSQYTIVSSTQAQTVINNLVQGAYTFELKVTDNQGATGSDTVTVNVNAAPNQSPVADAGTDITITLPTNSVTLSGSGDDPDGTIASYSWTRISGPAQYSILSSNQAQTTVNNLAQGVYLFELRVTDNQGASATDTVQVTVNAAPLNQPPTADAGPDIDITLPTNSVTLSGSGDDPDGTVASYSWTKISGPGQYTIVSSGQAQTTVNNLVQGAYSFELKVTDNQGGSTRDTVLVTVNVTPPPPNQAPTANAGADINITLPTSSITLSGSGNDADGTISSYRWTKISGPNQYFIQSSGQAQTTVNNLVQGAYLFELRVTDNQGASATDTLQVTVNPAPANQPPVANAGADIVITLPTNSITLTGSGNDPDGTISSYRWRKISGPNQYSITSSSQAQTGVNNLVQGVYSFELRVTDNNGTSSRDTVQVTVNAAPNQAPIANAGADITITLPTNSVTLLGSGNDPDGTIASYSWARISGPTQYTIVSANQAQTVVNNLAAGVYSFELTVTDNKGATAKDTLIVTVNAALPNQSPMADAGANIVITLPVNSATLSGSGNDPDGSIASYTWTKISGPAQYTVVSSNQAQTAVNNLAAGVYSFELRVTDNQGASARDTVNVTVNAAVPNQLPTAVAGTDITITLPTNGVTLSGSGNDADGSIASYQWTKISGPTQYSIASSGQPQTTVNNLVQGVYSFELRVTDNQGGIARDTVQVTVNAAPQNQLPIANAGPDIDITLPTNNVTLSGSGYDPDGTIASYRWTKISGPSQSNMGSSRSISTPFSNLVSGVYLVELRVTDNSGGLGRDTMQVTVRAAAPPLNQPPTANAGADLNITLPISSVTLSGSGIDPDGTITNYQWTKVSGPVQYNIGSSTQAQTTVNNLAAGVYSFALTVTDNKGATGKDTVIVTVNAAAPVNQSPSANAGADINITLPVNSTVLTGSGIDPDGTIVSYQWTKISGPAQYAIVSSAQSQTTVNNLAAGVYSFALTVTDNKGATAKDTVTVTVNAAAPVNQAPSANAGADINITLPVNSTVLTGSGIDPDGTIVSYQWVKISGPAQYTIVSSAQSQTTVNNLAAGVYSFELAVTDNKGATGKDTVMVTVNAAAPGNQAPVANAGADITITLPVDSVKLNGSGADADGTIASYQWTKISGPSQSTIVAPGQASTTINNLAEGVYEFELTATDNSGAAGKDTVQVTVKAQAVNQPPVANAGPDVDMALPATSVILSGTGTDADGTIASYQWTKISGPSQYIISSPTDAQITVSNLVLGEYQFELTVTDNSGATAKDTVKVTLNDKLNSTAKIFPNPATDQINIQMHSVSKTDKTSLRIYDSKGLLVYQESFVRAQQTITKQVDISKLSNGVYYVELNVDINKIMTLMFVKQ